MDIIELKTYVNETRKSECGEEREKRGLILKHYVAQICFEQTNLQYVSNLVEYYKYEFEFLKRRRKQRRRPKHADFYSKTLKFIKIY